MTGGAPILRYAVRDGIAPRQELALVGTLLDAASADRAAPPTLLVSRLTGKALALGRFQRRATVWAPADADVVRRHTGGIASRYGEGQASLCLVVPDLEGLVGVPFLDKVINRCVRGSIKGLTSLGWRAMYGGRDHLMADGRRVALVSMAAEGNCCLFQAVLGLSEAPHPAADGPPWGALSGRRPELTFAALAEALASGHAAATGRTLEKMEFPDPAPSAGPPGPDETPGLIWGNPVPVPIGTVSAGVRLADGGRLEALALAGELMLDTGAVPALNQALVGTVPDETTLQEAVRAVFADPARHAVLGVPDLTALVRAVLSAAGVCRNADDAGRV